MELYMDKYKEWLENRYFDEETKTRIIKYRKQ